MRSETNTFKLDTHNKFGKGEGEKGGKMRKFWDKLANFAENYYSDRLPPAICIRQAYLQERAYSRRSAISKTLQIDRMILSVTLQARNW